MQNSQYEKINIDFLIEKGYVQKSAHKSVPHYHNICEIIYFISGEARYFLHNKCYSVGKGSIVFVDSFEMHKAIYSMEKSERVLILYHPSVGQLGQPLKSPDIFNILNESLCNCRLITLPEKLQQYMQEIVRNMLVHYDSSSRYRDSYLYAYFIIFLTQIAEYLLSNDVKNPEIPDDTRVSSVLTYINQNLGNNISLDGISSHMSMSKYYLCRLFRQYTGLTIVEYVNQKRIIEAEMLIGMHKYSITDIAGMVGFNNLSHFEKVFKSITGVTPRHYKKSIAGRYGQ